MGRSCRKSVLACILLGLMTTLMTLQKTSLITSLRVILQDSVAIESGYAYLTVLILAPYSFNLVLMTWNIPFLQISKKYDLPPMSSVVLGIFAALVEAACVVSFTTKVMAQLPVYVALPAAHGVLAVTSVMASFRSKKITPKSSDLSADDQGKKNGRSLYCSGARIMASVMCLLVPPGVAVFMYAMDLADAVTSLSLAVIPCLLGLIWTPELQEHILNPNGNAQSHRKLQLFYELVKIFGVLLFILAEMYIRSTVTESGIIFQRFLSGFSIFSDSYVILPLLIHFLSCLVGFALSYTSVALCQPLFGIVLPSLFSMVISIVLSASLGPLLYGMNEVNDLGSFSPMLICASVLAWSWAWPYILCSSSFLRRPLHILTPYTHLFLGYGWNAIFNDPRLLINYSMSTPFEPATCRTKVKNRIYICTTMYREADYEMERLLISLEQVSSHALLEHVHFESNVFMDNGCSGDTLNEFALQFVALLVKQCGVKLDQTSCWRTPYGMQLFCKLRSGLPLFVHFKDPKKVKSKKRWSQAMYINYVMKFRKRLWRTDAENELFDGEGGGATVGTGVPTCVKTVDEEFTEISLDNTNQFMLRKVSNVGFPTLAEFRTAADSDQGFASVDSTPPNSDSGSQGFVYSSSKESSDVDSLSEEKCQVNSQSGYINRGYLEHQETAVSVNQTTVTASIPKNKETAPESVCKLPLKSNEVHLDDTAYVDDDHTFILATDADMDFKAEAVNELLSLCNEDKRIGAACGRTHPIGKKRSSIVWHQVFEYAKDFWMIKNAQNIIGSVSCCPGCFSLYRASAIRGVMEKYSSPTRSPFTVYVKDTGEDRWMATLMMINGWHMRYSPFADNTTYCPDSFQEYYKQRRRWILSDIANAVLVVQNLIRLVRNNDCFSLMYVMYLVNMFLNNVITPGTAIVMITAGLELVFEVPYIYTTIPMAAAVYGYAFLCTCTSVRTQGILTSCLTVLMGSLFTSVAVYGSYKITMGMVTQIEGGNFRFQQHYVILLLALSLVYASFMHPRESYQIVYGIAYLFIFPAMHVLLPIYSIANIVDQSWGTRDTNTAKLPKISCMPSLKRLKRCKKPKTQTDTQDESEEENESKVQLQSIVTSNLVELVEGDELARREHQFWASLISTHLGNDVNIGLEKADLAQGLRSLRNRTLTGLLVINALWLVTLSYFYMGLDSPLSRLNIYGVISGTLYGFTLIVQIVGLTVGRAGQVLRRVGKYVNTENMPIWIYEKEQE